MSILGEAFFASLLLSSEDDMSDILKYAMRSGRVFRTNHARRNSGRQNSMPSTVPNTNRRDNVMESATSRPNPTTSQPGGTPHSAPASMFTQATGPGYSTTTNVGAPPFSHVSQRTPVTQEDAVKATRQARRAAKSKGSASSVSPLTNTSAISATSAVPRTDPHAGATYMGIPATTSSPTAPINTNNEAAKQIPRKRYGRSYTATPSATSPSESSAGVSSATAPEVSPTATVPPNWHQRLRTSVDGLSTSKKLLIGGGLGLGALGAGYMGYRMLRGDSSDEKRRNAYPY